VNVERPIVHVVGARPNFVKAAPVLRALHERGAAQVLIHTGQHYDSAMSDVFFVDLGLPEPHVNLGVGSGSHAQQTAAVMAAIEPVLLEVDAGALVVYGDVNSTLAAALVATKLSIPVVHVEAGLRSFDMAMPEEVNRRLVDQISDLLLITSPDAAVHLGREGIAESRVRFVGNPMIDSLFRLRERFTPDEVMRDAGVAGSFAVTTIHRPSNVDDPARAAEVVEMLHRVADELPVVIPLHPRGRATLLATGLDRHSSLRIVDPMGYQQFLSLVSGATVVVTDSGGIQEETTMLDVPCITVRDSTERPITISHGTNRLMDLDAVPQAVREVMAGEWRPSQHRPPLWDGHAGERCAEEILSLLDRSNASR